MRVLLIILAMCIISCSSVPSDFTDKVFSIKEESIQPVVYELSRREGKISGSSKLLTEEGYLDSELKVKEDGKGIITLTTLSNGIATSTFVGRIKENSGNPFFEGNWQTDEDSNWIPTKLNIDSQQYSYYSETSGEKLWKELCKQAGIANQKYGAYCESLRILNELYKLYKPDKKPSFAQLEKKPFSYINKIPLSESTQRLCFTTKEGLTVKKSECCKIYKNCKKSYDLYKADDTNFLITLVKYNKEFSNCNDDIYSKFRKEHIHLFENLPGPGPFDLFGVNAIDLKMYSIDWSDDG